MVKRRENLTKKKKAKGILKLKGTITAAGAK
jgi:hypothetical protein